MENARKYHPGGFHPIHIGDTFKHGQYIVVQKLGHGQFSTVWLTKDLNTQAYVSLKVLAANASAWSGNPHSVSEELQVLLHLRNSVDQAGKDCVVRLLDDFTHTGPNGEHQCIVTELLGPKISSDIEDLYPSEIFPLSISRVIIKQLAYAIRFLHRNNVVHGDLHEGNILLSSPKLSALSEDDIGFYYGKANGCMLNYGVDGVGEPPNVPRYIVDAPYATPLLRLCLNNPAEVRVKLSDFSESSIITAKTQPKKINMPCIYRAPEIVLRKLSVPAVSVEIWALAVLFHAVYTGGSPIFHDGGFHQSEDKLLKNIVLQRGKLPEPFWSMWDQRFKYFDGGGRALDKSAEDTCHLQYEEDLMVMSAEERVLFKRVIQTMLVPEPEKRITIEDVVKSEWFVKFMEGPSATLGKAEFSSVGVLHIVRVMQQK